ncbi:heterokaryon incompatibility protein-domain-containing protein [Hypomontagnella monticulosa]|nr:heterokaryon incompatibility protein-domain-containing protein [Hypomontagnella monticulosa]
MSIRLIDTKSYRMKSLRVDSVKYAILSHRWVEGEEITYEKMLELSNDPNHPARQWSGYQKIKQACDKALSREYRYVWVDTCCIDKKSSAELSEAINSMYGWYQNSSVCFVWLSDLSQNANIETELPRCVWFTRGWCLQELLAPRNIRFYNRQWTYIGDKISLGWLLSKITNIDKGILAGNIPLSEVPVARRMSWAAKRKTEKVEDLAYCLLGIFDINMPLLYGEGTKAFLRLQEEIIKRSNDLTIFFTSTRAEQSNHVCSAPVVCDTDEDAEAKKYRHAIPHRNLFAESPRGFMHCGQVAANNVTDDQSFAMSNKGLYFKTVQLITDEDGRFYRLPLNCYRRASNIPDDCDLLLRKIGPNMFVRVRLLRLQNVTAPRAITADRQKGGNRKYAEGEAYIITQVTQSIRTMIDTSDSYFIQLQMSLGDLAENNWTLKITEVVPKDYWDPLNLRILIPRGGRLQGHMRIFANFSGDSSTRSKYTAFYLLYRIEGDLEGQSKRRTFLSGLRFFATDDWERIKLQSEHRNLEGMAAGDRFKWGKIQVNATITQTLPLRIGIRASKVEDLVHRPK